MADDPSTDGSGSSAGHAIDQVRPSRTRVTSGSDPPPENRTAAEVAAGRNDPSAPRASVVSTGTHDPSPDAPEPARLRSGLDVTALPVRLVSRPDRVRGEVVMVPRPVPWAVLGAISLGGMLGTLARYGLAVAFPDAPRGFPWATFAVNISGCLLIGVLMVLVADVWAGRRIVRPLLGTGLLGGYTTFSTYAVEVDRLARDGAVGVATVYLLGTVGLALAAVYAGSAGTRAMLARWDGRPGRRGDDDD